MRALLLTLLVVATAACGVYRFPGETAGTVSGHVTDVPCAPVEPVLQPCLNRPLSSVEIDFSGNGTTVSTRTDSRGDYSVELGAGTWKVNLSGLRIISGPPTVTVTAGAHVVANYVVDSGTYRPGKMPPYQGTRLISLFGTYTTLDGWPPFSAARTRSLASATASA